MADPQVIDVGICERLIDAATRPCPVAVQATSSLAPQPEWDALANSFASLSSAFSWGALLLGVLALLGGIAWARLIKRDAEEEARAAAKECVTKMMEAWLANEAPQIIRRHVENLQDASLGATNDAAAADEMGEEAG